MLDLQLVYELKVSYTVDLDPDLCEVVMIYLTIPTHLLLLVYTLACSGF